MRRSEMSRRKFRMSLSVWRAPAIIGLAIFLGFPSVAAYSDLATFLSGVNRGDGERWRMYLTRSPAGSVHDVDMVFADPITTGGLDGGAGMTLPDGRRVALTAESKHHEGTPDEDRVTRKLKKGRIVAVSPVTPPKDFSAGSILQRTSFLMEPDFDGAEKMAFAKPKIKGKEIEIATAFYRRKPPQPDPGVSPVLAKLVTNSEADILATAYVRPEPDYARVSPFDSILREDKNGGRFIPDIAPDDHAWAATALPATVFGKEEQTCLAEGIYFEARSESVKGQAAVAQVILNRVRNPTYPKTICGVVYQNKAWRNRCQFSFACDMIRDLIYSRSHWKTAKEVAMAVTAGKIWLPEVGSATHYHATYVKPAWAKTMKRVGQIGLHIFYRTYGGGWS
ncbi:cell wall hydrolase [Sinorhizobium sp. BJ1]|uniref:cell wall hydrolase n=1 Tax=Sinorhizobium sp. BJ1 TaxID=2035455 RepID=UPI0015CF32ED|nr:cell wall hydrolase [Sinorhizobium sp. BJ1]